MATPTHSLRKAFARGRICLGNVLLPAFLMLLASTTATADTAIDSLYRQIAHSPHTDVKLANRLMLLLDVEGATDSLVTFEEGIAEAAMMKDLHFSMANYYYELQSNMTGARQAALRAEEAARKDCDTAMIAEALSMQSVTAIRMGQMEVGLKAAQEELRLDQLTGDVANQARAYNLLAALSLQANRLDDAEQYVLKAIDMERSLEDSSMLSVRYGLATEIYAKRGEYERALEYGQRAYELDRTAGDEVKAARRLSQMADVYMAQSRYAEAETLCQRAIATLREEGEQKSLAITLKQLGQIFLKQKQHAKAHRTLSECEEICRATGHHYVLQQVCRMQAEAVGRQSPRQAVVYLEEALRLSDSLHTERSEQLAAEIRQSQSEELELREQSAARGRTMNWLILGGLLLADAVIVAALWLHFRRKQGAERVEAVALVAETKPEPTKHVDRDLNFLLRVTELYEKHLDKQRLSIDELAGEMCMSRSQFTRRMVAATGTVPSAYFNRLRMEKAARLLKESERPIGAIAYECGFDDTPYFCNLFKKFYKMTPMQYRVMPRKE